MVRALAATEATLVQETLENLAKSAKLFVDASDDQKIQLGDDVVPAALLMIANHFRRAAKESKERRLHILRRLADANVREKSGTLVDEFTHRSDPLHANNLTAWLECEGI